MLEVAKFGGIVPPVVTPLHADESLDDRALRRIVRRAVEAGVHGIFAGGSTGEVAALTDDVRRHALDVVLEEVGGQVPVLAGVGEAGTRRCADWARRAEIAGADAVVAILPYYYATSTVAEAVRHFEEVAAATALPVVLYNIPSRTKSAIPLEAVQVLCKSDRFIGIKDSAESLNGFYRLLQLRGPKFRVFQGSEMQAGPSLLMGADGAVLGICSLAPHLAVRIYEAAKAGDLARTLRYQEILADMNTLYWVAGGSQLGNLKYALHYVGLCEPYVTSPLASPDARAQARIREIVDRNRAEL